MIALHRVAPPTAVLSALLLSACGSPENGTPSDAAAPQRPLVITDAAIEEGRRLYRIQGCLTCHTTDGSAGTAPTLLGLYNSTRFLQDGREVTADVQYLRIAILKPNAELVEGYPPGQMLDYSERLDEQQVDALIAYIASLESAQPLRPAPDPEEQPDTRPDGRPLWWSEQPVRRGGRIIACGESIADSVPDARAGALADARAAIRLWADLPLDAELADEQPELAAVRPLPNPGGADRYVGYVQLSVRSPADETADTNAP